MDPNPPPDLTQPSETRAWTILAPDGGTGTGTGTILTPDPSVGTGQAPTPAAFSPAQVQAMRDALAAINGYSFQAAYGTPSEEPEQEQTLPEPTVPEHGRVVLPPGYSGPPAEWSPSTVDAPVREATMMYSTILAHQLSLGPPNSPTKMPFLIPSPLNLPVSTL